MDFVILWVDNKDPKWKEKYSKYSLSENGIKEDCRFRSWDNLHYWFRGVDKFAPWVNKIFFITANQAPAWLNKNHPKLRLINHEDYIPKELLPTFNSNTIEMFLHLIPDLSEHFVLFNDDFFIINKLSPKRFFIKGKPVDICAMNAYHGEPLSTNCMCVLEIINKHFNQKEVIKKNFFKWFSPLNGKRLIKTLLLVGWPEFVGFYDPHLPQPFLKSTLKEVWDKEKEEIINSLIPRFRQKTNLTQYLYRYWQLVTGKFVCRHIFSDSVVFHLNKNEHTLLNAVQVIKKQSKSIVVINDSEEIDFETSKKMINQAFDSILPEKSSFEK